MPNNSLPLGKPKPEDPKIDQKFKENTESIKLDTKDISDLTKRIKKNLLDLDRSLRDELKTRQKYSGGKGSFLQRNGLDAISITEALTKRNPIIGLGIKYLLERRQASKNNDIQKKRLDIAEHLAYLKSLKPERSRDPKEFEPRKKREPKEKIDKEKKEPKKKTEKEKTKPETSSEEPEIFEPRKKREPKEKIDKEKKEPKKKTEKEKTKPETSSEEPEIKDAEFEDIPGEGWHKWKTEEAKKGLGEAPPIITLPPPFTPPSGIPNAPIVPPPPEPKSEAPKLLGPGKLKQKRNEEGQFTKGFEEGNYVPKQTGVESYPKPVTDNFLGSLQDDYEKDFKDKNKTTEAAPKLLAEETKIYTILDLTRKDLEKYHKEETEQTDAQLVALEEAREKGTGEGIPKLLGPGGEKGLSKTNGPGGQQNLLKTLTEFKLSEFVLSKITPIAQAALASIGGMAGLAILGTTIGTALGIHEVIDHFTPKDAQGNVLGSDNKPSKLTTKGKFLENAVGGSKMALLHLSAWTLAKLGFGQKTSETKTLPPNTDEKGNVKIKKEDVTLEKSTEPPSEAPTLVPPASGNNPPSMPVLQDSMDVPAPKSEEPQLALKNPGNMKLDKDGLDMLTGHEGFKTQPYKDGKTGKLAIGYGHQILPGEHFTTITEPEGRKLLTKDVALSEQAVNNAVKVPITQKMFNSLVDYTYNTGKSGGPALDHITKILNSRNYKATREILKRSWITSKDTTKPKGEDHPINPNLVKRRGEEAEIGFSDSEIAMLPKQAPNQGKSILETQKQTEDKKSAIQTANTGNKGNTVIAPSNTNLNNTNIIAQQHNPRNTDDSYKDARYRDSFSG